MNGQSGATLTLIYVLGRGRSGSTFFERSAAMATGATNLGEVRLWPSCYRADHICSCGQPKTDCVFWSPVITSLPDQEGAAAAFRQALKRSFILSLLLPRALADRAFPGLRARVGAFYGHMQRITGISVALDSSKNPAYALVLDQAAQVDLRIVHIVRHPLGVVYSWKRQRNRSQDVALYRTRKSLLVAAIEWTASNLMAELAKRRAKAPCLTIAYEALDQPSTQAKLDALVATLPEVTSSPLGRDHVMSGNPGAAARQIAFKVDEEWKTGLAWSEKVLYGALTYPLYVFYRGL